MFKQVNKASPVYILRTFRKWRHIDQLKKFVLKIVKKQKLYNIKNQNHFKTIEKIAVRIRLEKRRII